MCECAAYNWRDIPDEVLLQSSIADSADTYRAAESVHYRLEVICMTPE